MNGHTESGRADAPHAAGTGELKRASPAMLERERHTTEEGGDLTPTQSRTTSPLSKSAIKIETSCSTAVPTNDASLDASLKSSVDQPEVKVNGLLHVHSPQGTEHVFQAASTVYDPHPPKIPSSPLPSRKLTPKISPAASAAPNGVTSKAMPDNPPYHPPSSGSSRSTPARRQQQQGQGQRQQPSAQQPYQYYASSPVSESSFRRTTPSVSGRSGHASFAHTQQPATAQHPPAGYVGQYTISPPPASLYSQHPVQGQFPFPQLNVPGMPPVAHAHTHSTPDFYPVGHSASPIQPPPFATTFHTSVPPEHTPTPAPSFDYERATSSARSPPMGAGSPYTSHQPFTPFTFHPTLTATPQFTQHSPFSPPFLAHHAQHGQRPQYPPSFGYIPRASPTSSEDITQQHQPTPTWWYIPSHSGSPTAGPFSNVYYVDAYGNPSNPGLGLGPGPPSSSSHPSHPPTIDVAASSRLELGSGMNTSGPALPSEQSNKVDLVASSSRISHTPSPLALNGSVSERGHRQQQYVQSKQTKQSNRRSNLPNPPAQRSEWVMWVGNVPSDATYDELWRFFTRTDAPNIASPIDSRSPYQQQQLHHPLHLPAGLLSPSGSSSASDASLLDASGVQSVFLISRSNCAFVNYATAVHLAAAIQRSNGVRFRPTDPRSAPLVCRVRGLEEDLRAGVGAQRGTGLHTRWIREQREREEKRTVRRKQTVPDEDTSVSEPPGTPLSAVLTESGTGSPTHESRKVRRPLLHSSSSGSTTSGFLARYFPKRYFILKSLTQFDLDLSVEKGLWATQSHNETELNKAYRNSSDVFLIFSVNKSGEFYGYARMTSPIGKSSADRVSWASRTDSQHSLSPAMSLSSVAGRGSQVSETIPEENEGVSPEDQESGGKGKKKAKQRELEKEGNSYMLFSPSEHRLAEDSPLPVTPATQKRLSTTEKAESNEVPLSGEANTAPAAYQPHKELKGPLPQISSDRYLLRPSSPTSAPAVMGPPYRKLTNPHMDGLASETMDPRLLRRRPPSVQLDPEAPIRAIREHDTHESDEEQPVEDADGVKRRDTLNNSASGTRSVSKLREVMQAEPLRPPTVREPQPGPGPVGTTSDAQEEILAKAERDDLPTQWGTPFKVQWIRTGKLPFTRTRHLRNPWNHEREVKVSRDGTELEPSVGQALLDEWDKEEPPAPSSPASVTGGGGVAGNASPFAVRRGTPNRRTQPHAQTAQNATMMESDAGPSADSPRTNQPKPRTR